MLKFADLHWVHTAYNLCLKKCFPNRSKAIRILVLFSKTGVGKTYGTSHVLGSLGLPYIKHSASRSDFMSNKIDRQSFLILDEFAPTKHSIQHLNEMCDVYPPDFNIKYGQVSNRFIGIIVCTNYPWEDWFRAECGSVRNALRRRLIFRQEDSCERVVSEVQQYAVTNYAFLQIIYPNLQCSFLAFVKLQLLILKLLQSCCRSWVGLKTATEVFFPTRSCEKKLTLGLLRSCTISW